MHSNRRQKWLSFEYFKYRLVHLRLVYLFVIRRQLQNKLHTTISPNHLIYSHVFVCLNLLTRHKRERLDLYRTNVYVCIEVWIILAMNEISKIFTSFNVKTWPKASVFIDEVGGMCHKGFWCV